MPMPNDWCGRVNVNASISSSDPLMLSTVDFWHVYGRSQSQNQDKRVNLRVIIQGSLGSSSPSQTDAVPSEKCQEKTVKCSSLPLTGRDTCEGLLRRRTNPQNKWKNWPLTMIRTNDWKYIHFYLSNSNILHTFSHLLSKNHLICAHGMCQEQVRVQ